MNGNFDKLVEGKINIFQAILSPQFNTIACGLCSSLKEGLAYDCNKAVKTWLEDVYDKKKKGVNIVILDFPRIYDVVPSILKLNDLIE